MAAGRATARLFALGLVLLPNVAVAPTVSTVPRSITASLGGCSNPTSAQTVGACTNAASWSTRKVRVAITAPSSTGGATITAYKVYANPHVTGSPVTVSSITNPAIFTLPSNGGSDGIGYKFFVTARRRPPAATTFRPPPAARRPW